MAKRCTPSQTTLFSSSWMPLWGSMKMTSLPQGVWLPCRSLAKLISAVPISWLPIRTLTRLVWAPFSPGRRSGWSSPGPRWLLPSGWVPILVYFSESSASWLLRSCPLWPSTSRMTLHDNFWRASHESSQEWESARKNLFVVSRDLCFGAPRLVRIDELHSPEVQSCDCRLSLGLNRPLRAVSLSKTSTPLGVRAILTFWYLVTLCLPTRVAPEFSHDSGSRWFFPWENGHEATIKVTCWAKLRRMIIGGTINIASLLSNGCPVVDLTLHFIWTLRQRKSCKDHWYSCFL